MSQLSSNSDENPSVENEMNPLLHWFLAQVPVLLLAAVLIGRPFISTLPPDVGPLVLFTKLLLLASVVWLSTSALSGKLKLHTSGGFLSLFSVFLLWMFFTLFFSVNQFFGAQLWCAFFSYGLVLFLVLQLSGEKGRKNFLFSCLLSTAAAVIIFALFHRVFVMPGFREWAMRSSDELVSIIGLGEHLREDLLSRMRSQHVISNFLTGNQLASFLLLFVFPFAMVVLGQLQNMWERGLKNTSATQKAFVFFLLIILAAHLIALFFSGSKGAIIAFLLVSSGLIIVSAKKWLSKNKKILAGILIALVLVVSSAVSLSDTPNVNALKASLGVRLGYWDVTRRMIKENPLTGIGPGSWGTYYSQYKLPQYEETRLPHSFYLLILSESGVPALALVLGALILGFAVMRRQMNKNDKVNADACSSDNNGAKISSPHPASGYIIAALYFIFDYFIAGSLKATDFAVPQLLQAIPWISYLLVFAVWSLFFHLLYSRELIKDILKSKLVGAGIVCGLAAFFIHITAELSMIIPAAGTAAFALMGFMFCGTDTITLKCPKIIGVLSMLLFIPVLLITFYLVPAAIDFYIEERTILAMRKDLTQISDAEQKWETQQEMIDHYRYLVGLEPIFESERRYAGSRIKIGRWNAELWAELAGLKLSMVQNLTDAHSIDPPDELLSVLLNTAEQAARQAIQINGLNAKPYRIISQILFRKGRGDESIKYAETAAELNPSVPRSWFDYAGTIEREKGLTREACQAYRKAHFLNDPQLQYHQRNLLSPEQESHLESVIRQCEHL